MALRLADKQEIVKEVAHQAKSSISAIAADYRGLTVTQINELRTKARASGVIVRVVRNTLAKRALSDTDHACLHEVLSGPIILLFSREDASAAARILRDFTKEHEQLKVKALALSGQLLSADQLTMVANLPTYEEAVAKLMLVMKAPITQLVRTMAETYARLVRVIAAIRDKKS